MSAASARGEKLVKRIRNHFFRDVVCRNPPYSQLDGRSEKMSHHTRARVARPALDLDDSPSPVRKKTCRNQIFKKAKTAVFIERDGEEEVIEQDPEVVMNK